MVSRHEIETLMQKSMLTNPPIPYDLYMCIPISCLLTLG